MWAVYGDWGMVVAGLVGALLVVVYCFLQSVVNAKAMAVTFAAIIVALFIGASFLSGSRGVAVYDDRIVHRPAYRGADLQTAHFDDLERVEIGCATSRGRRGAVTRSLVYRLVFRDGFGVSLSSGDWKQEGGRYLAVLQAILHRALQENVPVRMARYYGGDGAPMSDPVCMMHVVDRYQGEEQAIVRGLFRNIGWSVSGPLPVGAD